MGEFKGGEGTLQVLLDKICALRSLYAAVPDMLDGRMPLPYMHLMQLLVDTFLIVAPFTLIVRHGWLSILYVFGLTMFYGGLLNLCKMLLDPLDNDGFYTSTSPNIDVGVLIRESNAGSTRWEGAASVIPNNVLEVIVQKSRTGPHRKVVLQRRSSVRQGRESFRQGRESFRQGRDSFRHRGSEVERRSTLRKTSKAHTL